MKYVFARSQTQHVTQRNEIFYLLIYTDKCFIYLTQNLQSVSPEAQMTNVIYV